MIIVVDFGLLWWLWPRLIHPSAKWIDWWNEVNAKNDADKTRSRNWLAFNKTKSFSLIASFSCFLFIFGFANISGGTLDRLLFLENFQNRLDRNYTFPNRTFVREEPASDVLAAFIAREKELGSGVAKRGGYAWRNFAKLLDLSGRSFRSAQISSAYFYNARLQWTDFSQSNLWNADFRAVTMNNAILQGAFLELASFQQANLRQTKFHGASMEKIRLEGTQMFETKLLGVNLNDGRLDGADLRRANLAGSTLSGAQFRGAVLGKADLRGTDLTGVQMQGADLRNAHLGGSTLLEVDLTLADLRGVQTVCPDDLYWTGIKNEIGAEVKHPSTRKKVLQKIDSRIAEIECGNTITKVILKDAICDGGKFGNVKCTFNERQEKNYFDKLVDFLAESLACPKGNDDVAAGIAYRIHMRALIKGASGEEILAFRRLGAKILDKECSGAHDLPKWLRVPIERDLARKY